MKCLLLLQVLYLFWIIIYDTFSFTLIIMTNLAPSHEEADVPIPVKTDWLYILVPSLVCILACILAGVIHKIRHRCVCVFVQANAYSSYMQESLESLHFCLKSILLSHIVVTDFRRTPGDMQGSEQKVCMTCSLLFITQLTILCLK